MPDAETSGEEIQVVIFSLGNEEFGARTDQIKEIIETTDITIMPKAPSYIKGTINLRGDVIAVVDLALQLDMNVTERGELSRIIVVDLDDNIVGMMVDSASDVLVISTDNIDPTPAFIESKIDTTYIEGIGKIKDRLFVLLDLQKVLSTSEMKGVDKATES